MADPIQEKLKHFKVYKHLKKFIYLRNTRNNLKSMKEKVHYKQTYGLPLPGSQTKKKKKLYCFFFTKSYESYAPDFN